MKKLIYLLILLSMLMLINCMKETPSNFELSSPKCSIVTPENEASFDRKNGIKVTADVADNDGEILSVLFYIDDEFHSSINTPPFSEELDPTLLSSGKHKVKVISFDNDSLSSTDSISINIVNEKPSCIVTTPVDSAEFTRGTIELTSDASDDVSVTKVECYIDGHLSGTIFSAPYTFNWDATEAKVSTYSVKMVAYDTDNEFQSDSVIISIINTPPTCSIINPVNEASFIQGEDIVIEVNSNDSLKNNPEINMVRFYIDNELVAEDKETPYSYKWQTTISSTGTHNLKAIAIDNDGDQTADEITITLIPPNVFPVCSITSPNNNDSYSQGETVNLATNAVDEDGTITNVSFYLNNSLLTTMNTAPYEYNWQTNDVQSGFYTIKASAMDNENAVSSDSIIIQILNAFPSCNITNPSEGDIITKGESITIQVAAHDILTAKKKSKTINNIKFYIDDELMTEDTTIPYSYVWNTAVSFLGDHKIKAVSIDNDGAQTTDEITITIVPPNSLPTCSITNPGEGDIFTEGDVVNIAADANDTDGSVSSVKFFINDILKHTDESLPYTYSWNTVGSIIGSNKIKIIATDNQNDTAEDEINVIVPPNSLPTCSITNPGEGDIFTEGDVVNIAADATDTDGSVSSVKFFINDILKHTDESLPYTYSWNTVGSIIGSNKIKIIATDNQNDTAEDEINVIVNSANLPPVCEITNPADSSHFSRLETIDIQVNSTDDGDVDNVTFYFDGNLINTDILSPYSYSLDLSEKVLGEHTITVRAEDNDGVVTEDQVKVFITIAPHCDIISPENDKHFTRLEDINIEVLASDDDGSIVNLKYFFDDDLLDVDAVSPYTFNLDLSDKTAGIHTITAIAEDNEGINTNDNISIFIDNIAPVISIVAPTDSLRFNVDEIVEINVDASDVDGGIAEVKFMVDNIYIGSDFDEPYSFNWVAAGMRDYHTIRVIVKDSDGVEVEGESVSIYVTNIEWEYIVESYTEANSIKKTSDGGFVVAGYLKPENSSYADFFLNKISSTGKRDWSHSYSISPNSLEKAYSVQQTTDGGFIIGGSHEAQYDHYAFWIVKTDEDGNKVWDKEYTFGKENFKAIESIRQTTDGGYIVAGYITHEYVAFFPFLFKISADGTEEWNRDLSMNCRKVASAQLTPEDGLIIAGSVICPEARVSPDCFLIKTSSSGDRIWNKTYGVSGTAHANSVQLTSDLGYIIAGKASGSGAYDGLIIKVDANGNEIWSKTYGGAGWDNVNSVQQTSDGGYIVAGSTNSYGSEDPDLWIIKTDELGSEIWNETYNGRGYDDATSIQLTTDGGYIVAGSTTDSEGKKHVWILKLKE